jgi:flagellar hook-length control protein FliK
MSALTLLSVIAPAVPSVPQGPSDEAASGFRDLLAALSGEEAAVPVTKKQAEPSKANDVQVEAETDAPAAAAFLAAPTTPTPLVFPAAEEASATGVVPAPADATNEPDGTQATTPLPVDKASTTKTTGPEVLPGEQDTTPVPSDKGSTAKVGGPEVLPREQSTTPLLTDKGPNTKPPRPEVQPPLRDVRPVTTGSSDTELTLAETAAATEAVEAHARTGAAPTPTTLPPAAPPPPPLRPSAERTGRLLGPVDARTGDGSRVADPARPASAPAQASPAVAASPAAGPATAPPDFAATAAAMARDMANGGESEGPPSEPPPPVESTTAQTQASAGPRETGVSQLSRATIEATAQIAAQILRRLEGRSTRFEMALTPDELGRVDVKLDIDSEGRLNARLAFDNPAAATDLRGRADELRRELEEAGFQLAEDAFEFADRDSNSSAFDRGQDARHGSSRAFAAATRLNNEIDVAQPPGWLALSLSPSGVDMKV